MRPLLLSAAVQQSTDISCSPGPQQKTCSCSGFAAVGPCWDRHRTVNALYNLDPHTMRAVQNMNYDVWKAYSVRYGQCASCVHKQHTYSDHVPSLHTTLNDHSQIIA